MGRPATSNKSLISMHLLLQIMYASCGTCNHVSYMYVPCSSSLVVVCFLFSPVETSFDVGCSCKSYSNRGLDVSEG